MRADLSDPTSLDTIAMAAAIRSRQLSAVEVVDAHLERIELHNGALNAVVILQADRARALARDADLALDRGENVGPLHGVPFTIKDSFETEGLRTTASHRPLADNVPAEDAVVVARIRSAGAILMGKTNLPELAGTLDCDSELNGRASNPWDVTRTPGGSTGGGAAGVAARFSPFEVGSDAAGSIRVPAHFCGVSGFKPTDHLVPWAGHIPELPGSPRLFRQCVSIGPLARSVRDLQLLTRIIAGPHHRDWEVPPIDLQPVEPQAMSRLRLRWCSSFGNEITDRAMAGMIEGFTETLATAGAHVEHADPWGSDINEVCDAGRGLFVLLAMSGSEPGNGEPADSAHDLAVALSARDRAISRSEAFLDGWDAFVAPVAPAPAFRHQAARGEPVPVDDHEVDYWSFMNFCVPYNLTGQPSLVLPIGLTPDGLPVGVQVIARRWDDMRLLAIAAALEPFAATHLTPPPLPLATVG